MQEQDGDTLVLGYVDAKGQRHQIERPVGELV